MTLVEAFVISSQVSVNSVFLPINALMKLTTKNTENIASPALKNTSGLNETRLASDHCNVWSADENAICQVRTLTPNRMLPVLNVTIPVSMLINATRIRL